MGFFSKLFGGKTPKLDENAERRLDLAELAKRLNTPIETLKAIPITYREIRIPKRDGSLRILQAPDEPLKKIQRTILRRLLAKLTVHPAATGFEIGQSIATNAAPHVGAAVILKLDIKNFFAATHEVKVREYFKYIGWNKKAIDLLIALTLHAGGLPQGAPTSPRLSNLTNCILDARLSTAAAVFSARYTRYADDMTFSFAANDRGPIGRMLHLAREIVDDEGYELHFKKKLRIASQNDRMLVTGLVVNQKLNLPRTTRRRLRAVEHHLQNERPATLTPQQLQGWKSLHSMILAQQQSPPAA